MVKQTEDDVFYCRNFQSYDQLDWHIAFTRRREGKCADCFEMNFMSSLCYSFVFVLLYYWYLMFNMDPSVDLTVSL